MAAPDSRELKEALHAKKRQNPEGLMLGKLLLAMECWPKQLLNLVSAVSWHG